ncbi:hypothetical protein POX_a00744 [Penicillium oxalicum]|uniref:hypothetical protein n=1 Tax=Penicillium oxalicum TaxID=69781 RepID=UPI0020B8B972|nr:hypothetical protein POX_a00744 [Penicillium oxalicum]KAI2794154.1 hypothetical protein POX_a00744 [Penicillium oxalicum]
MASSTSSASLRARYAQAVTALLESITSSPKLTYSNKDLTELKNVTLTTFKAEDPEYVASKLCLFKPMPSKNLEESSFDEPKNADDVYYVNAERAFLHLTELYEDSFKRSKSGSTKLALSCGWTHIKFENPFSELPQVFLAGYRPSDQIPFWKVRAKYEWRNKGIVRPHIMLVVRTGAIAFEGELLFCELSCIAQAIKNRLMQMEFEATSLIPVFVISLCGPGNGRLIQANYDKSGILRVRASPVYPLQGRDSPSWRLFLQYLACGPYNGTDAEDADDSTESKYVIGETQPRKNIHASSQEQKPALQSTLCCHEEDKENAPPDVHKDF